MVGNALRCIELIDRCSPETRLPTLAFGKGGAEAQGLTGQHGRRYWDRAHGLHAPGQHHILGATHYSLCRKVHRLLGRAALSIYGGARHIQRQARRQPGGTGNITGQRTNGVNTAKNNVVVISGGDLVSLDEGTNHMRAEIGTVHGGQGAIAFSRGRAQCVNDISFCHKF